MLARLIQNSLRPRLVCRAYTNLSGLSEEHRMIRETVHDFANEKLVPFAGQWDQTHTFPTEAIEVKPFSH